MKKIYERPMAELTVFDAEDIICVSVNTLSKSEAELDVLVKDLNRTAPTRTVFGNFKSKNYNW